jgi:hypothetical protein
MRPLETLAIASGSAAAAAAAAAAGPAPGSPCIGAAMSPPALRGRCPADNHPNHPNRSIPNTSACPASNLPARAAQAPGRVCGSSPTWRRVLVHAVEGVVGPGEADGLATQQADGEAPAGGQVPRQLVHVTGVARNHLGGSGEVDVVWGGGRAWRGGWPAREAGQPGRRRLDLRAARLRWSGSGPGAAQVPCAGRNGEGRRSQTGACCLRPALEPVPLTGKGREGLAGWQAIDRGGSGWVGCGRGGGGSCSLLAA